MSPPTILITAAALTASLARVLIDQFIGLSGRAVDGSPAGRLLYRRRRTVRVSGNLGATVNAMLFVGLATQEPAFQA